MKNTNLFIGLPVYGGYHPHFVHSLIPLLLSPPCSVRVGPCIGDSLVARARNKIVADFLETDSTHLLFLDTDLIFRPEAIARLLSHNVPIVGGLYPKKQKSLAWVCNMLPESAPDSRGLQRVKYIGTGCLMIRRDVIKTMIAAMPEIAYTTDSGQKQRTEHDIFPCAPMFDKEHGQMRYHSEDWGFCRRALDLGYHVLADTCVALKHVGDCIYPIDDPFELRSWDMPDAPDFDTTGKP